jgi:hypothetical protein
VPGAPRSSEATTAYLADLGARLTTYLGQAFIALAVGYLLRASVERTVVAPATGISIGLFYALGWLAVSHLVGRRGNHLGAVFASTLALVLALPIVVEATWRFRVWSASLALIVLAFVVASALVTAAVNRQRASAWLVIGSAAMTAFVLMVAMRAYMSAAIFFLVLGGASFALASVRHWPSLRWPAAVLVDAAGLALAPQIVAAVGIVAYPVVVLARSFASKTAIGVFETVQSAALLIAGGAVVFDGAWLALFWSLCACVLSAVAMRGRSPLLLAYATGFALAAAGPSGLLVYATQALVAPEMVTVPPSTSALAVCLLVAGVAWLMASSTARDDLPRLAAALATTTVFLWCAAGLASGAASSAFRGHAAVSTIALACSACFVAAVARLRSLAAIQWAVYPFLLIVGLKLLTQMLRGQDPTALFVALAAYGSALMVTARRSAIR